jgi:hypothetical protein
MTLPYPPPFQDLATLAEHICTGESTIENWVRQGLFPAPKKIGGKQHLRRSSPGVYGEPEVRCFGAARRVSATVTC